MSENDMTPEERADEAVAGWHPEATSMRSMVARAIRADREARAASHAAEVARLERERDEAREEVKAQSRKLNEFSKRVKAAEDDARRGYEVAAGQSESHPWYGECDALGERSGCSECQRMRSERMVELRELRARLATAPTGWSAAKVRAAEACMAHMRAMIDYAGEEGIAWGRDREGDRRSSCGIFAEAAIRALDAQPQATTAPAKGIVPCDYTMPTNKGDLVCVRLSLGGRCRQHGGQDAQPQPAQGVREEARNALATAICAGLTHGPDDPEQNTDAVLDALDRYLDARAAGKESHNASP